MARDYRKELAAAVASQDVAALAALAYQLLGKAEADDDRRARLAEKKRLERERRLSATSGMSPDVAGRRGTIGDIPESHTPLRSRTTPPPSAQVIAKLGDEVLQDALDRVRELAGDEWEDVAGFFLRRKYSAWQAWADVMLKDVGMTSQFTGPDLAKVCRDDATLDKRIQGGGILRKFLGFARQERMDLSRSPPATGLDRSPRRGGSVAERTFQNGVAALIDP